MKLFFRLFFLQLNQRFGLSSMRAMLRDEKKKTARNLALFALVVFGVASLIAVYTALLSLLLPGFQQLGLDSVFLGLTLLLSMILVFVLGMFYLLGVLFFSKDTEFLTALPIPQRTIFGAKFAQVMISEIASSALLLLPPIIVYGVTAGADVFFWLRGALTLLLVPCIPLALSALIALLLMRFNALWRHRDLLTIVGSVLALLAYMASVMFFSAKIPQYTSPEQITALLSDNEGLLTMAVSYFPPSGWAARGILGDGGSLALFAAVSAAALAVVILVSDRIYHSGASAQLEAVKSSRKVKLSGDAVRQRGQVSAMFKREWQLVLRSPVYALNGLAMIVMGPIMMLFMVFIQGASMNGLESVVALISTSTDYTLVFFVLTALFMFFTTMNTALTTTISREGKLFFILRTLPVTPERMIIGKLLFGVSTQAVGTLLMGGVALVAFHLPVWVVVGTVLLSCLASFAPLALSVLPDLHRPKLTWNSETEAVKQNMSGVLGMLICMAYVLLAGFGFYWLIAASVGFALLIAIGVAASALTGALSLLALTRTAKRRWHAIEG